MLQRTMKSPCWPACWNSQSKNWKRITLIYSMLKLQRNPWRKRMYVKVYAYCCCLLWMSAGCRQVKLLCLLAGVQYGWVLIPTSLRCLKSVSVATYLVRMSAGFATVLTLMILTVSLSTNCWMKRCFSSICFAFFDDPILVAILSFHSKNPCRSWSWPSSCWAPPSRSCGCAVLLLLLCWLRRVLLPRCWVLLLIVCGFRNVLLLPCT